GRRRGLGAVEKRAVARLPVFLESLPRALSPGLIPQSPEQRGDQDNDRNYVMRRIRLAGYRILLGDWLLWHRFLQNRSLIVSRSSFAIRCPRLRSRAGQRQTTSDKRPATNDQRLTTSD